ncbi:MAG: hypothetical protein Q8N83_08360, partial [Ignavibacteria bacterium]|nr:hypothetical protein [Ignavibacteria bacterium]
SVTSLVLPQTTEDKNEEKKSCFKALQVGFLNEKALYYHNAVNEKFSLKSGVSVYWNYDEKKEGDGYNNYQESYGPEERSVKMKVKTFSSSYGIVFSSQLLYRFTDYEYVQIYVAFGPSLSYSFSKNSSGSSENTDSTFSKYNTETKNTVFGIGPSVSFIIKNHLYGNLSLVSEYNLSAYYTWNNNTYNYGSSSNDDYNLSQHNYYNNQNHQETKGWKMSLSDVRIGLLIEL